MPPRSASSRRGRSNAAQRSTHRPQPPSNVDRDFDLDQSDPSWSQYWRDYQRQNDGSGPALPRWGNVVITFRQSEDRRRRNQPNTQRVTLNGMLAGSMSPAVPQGRARSVSHRRRKLDREDAMTIISYYNHNRPRLRNWGHPGIQFWVKAELVEFLPPLEFGVGEIRKVFRVLQWLPETITDRAHILLMEKTDGRMPI